MITVALLLAAGWDVCGRERHRAEQRDARFGGSDNEFIIAQALVYQQATDATQASRRISGTPLAHPCEARASSQN